ncbi:type III restriction-modification system restriction subunit Res [Marinicella pacifica]|uniref:Type III restriction-modification system restriction subunit Res n=1 Tax=Marinicella pacifica TaxID=1171543 RepID=A0A917CEW3_9GAMM|nr:DEAD/DEAH box helicase [Marinicella pacifica]GGF86255.1 type III restriction-modification system restriction subunit Res [Marinicella pacifica]
METGLYEQLINKVIELKINRLDVDTFYIDTTPIDKSEASKVLSQYLSQVIQYALNQISGKDSLEQQIKISNRVIKLLSEEIADSDIVENIITAEANILTAILSKLNADYSDFKSHVKEITPYTRLSYSELFTGNNAGISLESEIKKEILSSDKVSFLVSFIKWTGIRIFEKELTEFTNRGGELKIITTSYMGATDLKAIQFLSGLKNTEIKVSYNTSNERLHAKAYLFHRNTGFHTGYIGSSNLSRSALTNGLEWNIKLTTQEVSHLIEKFKKTFETYWEDREFEQFDKEQHSDKLGQALKQERFGSKSSFNATTLFDIKPYSYQLEILEKLQTERLVHNRTKNLVVAATGTGKTVISAFDFKQFYRKNPEAKLLFVAHRQEILQQALATFQGVLKDNNFGELWVGGLKPERFNHVFASVQTLNNQIDSLHLASDYYDFIIIDEVHHISANSYRPILNHFHPKILFGLTATPERMDGTDILEDFCGVIAAEIRLAEALNRKLLCPFQYFGITDSVDLSNAEWRNGKYMPSELTRIYTENDRRVRDIIDSIDKYQNDIHNTRTLGFCASQEHAQYMAEKFNLAGLNADYLISKNNHLRNDIRQKFIQGKINYLFVVDIFNEGVDIPEIDTVLFLRPTESLTVFLQQLGRGLRLSEDKDCLTVLDFVGNARSEYDFETKFRAMIGKTNTSVQKELKDDFPHLPLGCSIVLEKKAKDIILANIKNATSFHKNHLIKKIRNFKYQTDLPLTLKNFINLNHVPLEVLYNRDCWMRLLYLAGEHKEFDSKYEKDIKRAILNKWLVCDSYTYLSFILDLAKNNFQVNLSSLSDIERQMALMLHYDVWLENHSFKNLAQSIQEIGTNKALVNEIIEVLELLIDRIDHLEQDIELPYQQPLKIHSRYTRDQILTAFGFSTFDKKSHNREGVALNKETNTELLFIDLHKSEEDYSPTTLYNDYAINDVLLHWQSQNATRPDIGKGLDYIKHKEIGRYILIFIRPHKRDEYNLTMGYHFLGSAEMVKSYGSKPMNITWRLQEPMPAYLLKESAKLAVG